MTFGTDIHGAQAINPNDVGNLFTFFPLAPPAGKSFHLYSEISQ